MTPTESDRLLAAMWLEHIAAPREPYRLSRAELDEIAAREARRRCGLIDGLMRGEQ